MNDLATQRQIRNRLLTTYRDLAAQYKQLLQANAQPLVVAAARHALERVERRYFKVLPRVSFGVCPFDATVLLRSFDPFGLDGPWWGPEGSTREPKACRHFALVGGAVRFGGAGPRGGAQQVYPGPEVPFVYPRILEMRDMVAVIAQLPMDHGLRAFAISYFSTTRPPGERLAGGWKATTHEWTTGLGETGFRIENEPWDFELAPWAASGKLRWCTPGSDNATLAPGTEPCPYLNLPGARRYQVVQGNHVDFLPLPDGREIDPFDP